MYVDASALLKLYVDEPDSAACRALLRGIGEPITARITQVEVSCALTRLLGGDGLADAQSTFAAEWQRLQVVEVDAAVCERAAAIGGRFSLRALDAIHLGAADPLRGGLPFVTYDRRQARAARALGWEVLGA